MKGGVTSFCQLNTDFHEILAFYLPISSESLFYGCPLPLEPTTAALQVLLFNPSYLNVLRPS